VIRARGKLEDVLASHWLGPAVAAVLVLLVLLIGLHPVADEFVEEAVLICAVIALAGVVVIPLVGGRPSLQPKDSARKQSSPRAAFRTSAPFFLDDRQPAFPLRR